ncbi:hypothetical protein Slin15195_G126060 [Septoria linicola]|uniref:Uncharacterized protein n=1 Tax=Septoria linicola TaxID=215465 RepID=A0A9Q9B077_9PEZI|nr:hypothetical protein Slin14017_G082240 [Septoria linicola]USW59287.1 hypothetical protein Slin15195_G126060 [Septoria linicola]
MPPIRTMPIVKPVRTERTHEENQERAYIAASRRSDRSLEARVESARRASEIHKKRTGRSLRVREEDVMNEEMYEEEDDDLPMQFRRINALNPGFAYSAFNERVNSYLQGQIGVRNYLHQAIYQANQNYNANQLFNPMLQQNGQQPWQANLATAQSNSHGRSASIATPQGYASQQPNDSKATTPTDFDARRSSANAVSPAATSPSAKRPKGGASSHSPTTKSEQHQGTPQSAQALPSPSVDDPLTFKLDPNMQQLVDGQESAFGVQSYQMTPGLSMPSMGYSYNPNAKSLKRDSGNGETGLNQTLAPFNMHGTSSSGPLYQEPLSAASAPGALDYNFGYDMLSSDFGNNFANSGDSKYAFDLDFGSGTHTGNANNSGQVTPAAMDSNWNPDDFFNYTAAAE